MQSVSILRRSIDTKYTLLTDYGTEYYIYMFICMICIDMLKA